MGINSFRGKFVGKDKFPEETYTISHHVHHALSDEPGDPYNAKAGLLYCIISDANHQGISTDLDEKEYKMVSN